MFLIFHRHNTPSGDFEEPKFLVSIEITDCCYVDDSCCINSGYFCVTFYLCFVVRT